MTEPCAPMQVAEDLFSLTIREIIARSSSIVTSIGGSISEPCTSVGIDPVSLGSAPIWKCVGVDIDAFDDVSLFLVELLGFLRRLGEFLPRPRQVFGVYEDRDEGIVIFLPAPRNTDDVGSETRIVGDGHDHTLLERGSAQD